MFNEIDGALQGLTICPQEDNFVSSNHRKDAGGSSLDATEILDIDGPVSSKWSC